MIQRKKVAIIGSGFSGLSAAAYAARDGHEVHVFEKNDTPGGRARQFSTENGYTFDMGPSWYWMPEVIERFFNDFGSTASDFFPLERLDPQFEIAFREGPLSLPDGLPAMEAFFERVDKGAGRQFSRFMEAARYKYAASMAELVSRPCHSWAEFLRPSVAKSAFRLDLLTNYRDYVARYFSDPRLAAIMEFPVIFLGAPPGKIPALYSLMNYGGYGQGTFYPMGGFFSLVAAMKETASRQGATFHFGSPVQGIQVERGKATHIVVNGQNRCFDAVIATSDYEHSESLLAPQYRNYTEAYWKSRTFAPSCLIYYLGFSRQIPGLHHHTLFFEPDFDTHINAIYTEKKWPEAPLFYACCPSKTDPGVAPPGCENLFLLMPVATGLHDPEFLRERYLEEMIARIEKHTGTVNLMHSLEYSRSYCGSDFTADYNAYGGNAYGLANTLRQTAVLKPSLRNRKVGNLLYAGQLTVPGPGVPPAIISGKIAATELKKLKTK